MTIEILTEVVKMMRNYPDFHGDTLMGQLMDEALNGRRHPLFEQLDLTPTDAPHFNGAIIMEKGCLVCTTCGTTDKASERIPMVPMTTKEGKTEWFFDCDEFYVDVAKVGTDFSLLFRNRINDTEEWFDQADNVSSEVDFNQPKEK